MTRIVFADVETTHVDPQAGHIWELALIIRDLSDGPEDVERLWQIRPDLTEADPMALRVGGFYERFEILKQEIGATVECPTGDEDRWFDGSLNVAAEVAKLIDGAVLVGQNAQFDAAHLAAFLNRNGQAYTAHYRPICVTTMAAGFLHGLKAERDAISDWGGVMPPAAASQSASALPWSSKDIARAVGVTPEDFDTHTALGDARLAMHLWDCLFQGGAA